MVPEFPPWPVPAAFRAAIPVLFPFEFPTFTPLSFGIIEFYWAVS
jgi:hypothetical protein